MNVPHSSDVCSGMCRPPCGHEGCWQCEKIVQVEAEKAIQQAQARVSKALNTLTSQQRSFAQTQTATITRVALENLCTRAGLEVTWNGGDPVIHDPAVRRDWRMNDVAADPLASAAKRIASTASTTIDQMVKEALKGPTPEVLRIQGIPGLHKQVDAMTAMRAEVEKLARAKAEQDEQEAREVLKAQGASDEDIAAAKALFDWKPTK